MHARSTLVNNAVLKQAEDLCASHGQPWRVATLEGWRLFHDPNMVTGMLFHFRNSPITNYA